MSKLEKGDPAEEALRKLGRDIRDARRVQHYWVESLALHARISRTTLYKIERGDPGVSIGNYARVLHVLGLLDPLAGLANAYFDNIRPRLDRSRLVERLRWGKPATKWDQ